MSINEGEKMEDFSPDPTEAELDEWLQTGTFEQHFGGLPTQREVRLIKALRAERHQSKAKDTALSPLAALPVGAEVESDTDLVIYKNAGRSITIGDILRARAALDKEKAA